MIFSRSQDGRFRANVHIRFRVGFDLLESAAAHVVWGELINENEPSAERAGELAGLLTRLAVERKLRQELLSTGYQGWGQDDEYYEMALDAAQPRVRMLYPKAYQEEE